MDYVWLDEAVEEVKQAQQISILSRYAVVYDRSSGTVLWEEMKTRLFQWQVQQK